MSDFAFSNFRVLDIPIEDAYGIRYPTVEHFYQASKALSPSVRKVVATQHTPGRAKEMGGVIACRPDWSLVKDRIMLYALRYKFAPGSDYAKLLLAAKLPIVEWNRWHDNYWGRCTCPRCAGFGQNRLGEMLEQIRKELAYDGDIF